MEMPLVPNIYLKMVLHKNIPSLYYAIVNVLFHFALSHVSRW